VIGLLASLLVQGVSVALSPLAIVGVLALLGTRRARINGLAFLAGWTVAVVGLLVGALFLANALEARGARTPPGWLAPVRLILGAVLLVAAIVIYRRGHAKVMAAARATTTQATLAEAPQLPSWLAAVDSFRPVRCFVLGLVAFLLNPVDTSCTIGAALDLSTAPVGSTGRLLAGVFFVLLSISLVLGPVLWYLLVPDRASRSLQQAQLWIARHTTVLNALVALIVAAMLLSKGLQGL
jgi:Sap, sulfolipid-1-addressing protein